MTTDILLICTDRVAELEASLPAALGQPDACVTVIDNACSDGSGELARAAGAEVLRLERRLSWCAANNAALAATSGEEVLLLNADCFLDREFLARARPRLLEEGVGVVAPLLLRTLGPAAGDRLQEVDAAGMMLDRRRKNGLVGHGGPPARFAAPGECFGADGAAALFLRAMLADCAVAGQVLDEDFEKYASDVDLAWRGWLLGWRCAYEPSARAWHVRSYGPSTRAAVPPGDRRAQFRNRYLMMAKNDRPPLRDLPAVARYELLALAYVLLRERDLLGGYSEALRRLPAARRHRREIMSRRRVQRAPLGLLPPRVDL